MPSHSKKLIHRKAIQYKSFGASSVIEVVEIPQPTIKTADDILIQAKAASVNPLDIKIRMGYMQKMRPVELPSVPGLDASGIVMAVGKHVSNFKGILCRWPISGQAF